MVEVNRHPDDQPTPSWWGRLLRLGLVLAAACRVWTGRPATSTHSPTVAAHPAEGDGQPPGGLLHAEVRHEHSDASFRWILGIIIGAMVFAAIVHAVVLRFFYSYQDYQDVIKRSNYPLASTHAESLPPEPRLEQVNRMAGIEKGNVYLREEGKEARLHSYGSTEEDYVHIPIDRAMDFLAGKLPARTNQPTTDQARRQNGLVDAGESNSGRMFRGMKHD